jgi:hypothetical protein
MPGFMSVRVISALWRHAQGSLSSFPKTDRSLVRPFPLGKMFNINILIHRSVPEKKRTRNVLISAKGSDDSGTICEHNFILGRGRKQALQKCDGRIEDYASLAATLHADTHGFLVNQTGAHVCNIGRRVDIEIN